MEFSLKWEPDQLAEWLLQLYGKAYQDDIGKLQKEKVNAELFLDLPDDEEFLKGLGLSLGFKKLVVKKANELKRQKAVVMDDETDGRSNVGSRSGMEKIEQQAHIGQGRGQITEEPVTGLAGNQHNLPDRRTECGSTTTSAVVDQGHLSEILASVPRVNRWKLDKEIDFEHKTGTGQTISKHLGKIADSMTTWDCAVADCLGLSDVDRSDIREKNSSKPAQQRRDALMKWKSGLGRKATYRALVEVFVQAGELTYANKVCNLLGAPVVRAATHGMTTHSQATTVGGHAALNFDQFEVKNHHLSLLEWTAVAGAQPNKVQIYDRAAVMWDKIAECLGLTLGDITSIHQNKFDDRERVTTVLHRWFDNAINLPNNNLYPKKWSGLIKLLNNSGLGELAESVREALESPCNSVRGNV